MKAYAAKFEPVAIRLSAVYHKCNPDSMEMYVAPIVGSSDKFIGSVYVMGHEDDDRCVFSRHGNDDETFYRLIRFDHCGGAVNRTDVSISCICRFLFRPPDIVCRRTYILPMFHLLSFFLFFAL